MSDDQIRRFLAARGVADHVVREGLAGLVGQWERFAGSVEAGYPLDWYSYLNDLDVRQLIEVVLRAMPQATGRLLDRLRDADERVRRATIPAGRCLGAYDGVSERRNWWLFVIPREPGSELAEDLRSEGWDLDRPNGH